MKSATRILSCLVALAAAGAARGQSVGFAHLTSIYVDAKEGPLRDPEGVGCNEGGSVLVADSGNGRLLRYSFKDGQVSGGTEIKLAQAPYPFRVQLDAAGNAYVLDRKLRRIARVDDKGGFAGYVDLKGTPAAANLYPGSIKVDAAGNLYVRDVTSRQVLVADKVGNVVRTLPLPAAGEFTDIAVDTAGNVYAVDGVAATVWIADKTATAFKTLTKSLKEEMNFPAYITVSKGRILLVDQNGDGLVILGIDGSYQGRQLAIGWNDGLLYYPAQICVGGGDEVFVADRGNNRVQVFTSGR